MSLALLYSRTVKGPWTTTGKDVQFRIEDNPDSIDIFFQGSVSKSDWFWNFHVCPVVYKRSPLPWAAHEGFVTLWKSARETVMGTINELFYRKNRPITTAGYSQGGALSLMCYEDVVFSMPVAEVRGYGFGCPRVVYGDVIANRFASFTRVQLRGDIVTHLPPAIMGYRHMGRETLIGPFSLYAPHSVSRYQAMLDKDFV